MPMFSILVESPLSLAELYTKIEKI